MEGATLGQSGEVFLSAPLLESYKFNMATNAIKSEMKQEVNLRTPSTASTETSPTILTDTLSVNQVTPEGMGSNINNGNTSILSSTDGVCNQRSMDTNSETAHSTSSSPRNISHPVSRRGGRFVSPSHRTASLITSFSKAIEEESTSAVANTQDVSGNDGSNTAVLEYKTFRSPSHKTAENNLLDALNLVPESKKIEGIALECTPVSLSDENARLKLASECVSSTKSLSFSDTRTGREVNQSQPMSSSIPESETSIANKLTYSPDASISSSAKRNNEEPLRINVEGSATKDSKQKRQELNVEDQKEIEADNAVNKSLDFEADGTFEVDANHRVDLKSPDNNATIQDSKTGNNTNIPCRSPPRNVFALDDMKSPGGGGIFWLSPGPPTPKSPSKCNGRELYMATPTEFFASNGSDIAQGSAATKDSSSNHRNRRLQDSDDKCPDTTESIESTSNVLAWLQSPEGMFSPGGFAPSLNNTPIHKTPRTPIVSTSFFFSDAASLSRNLAGGAMTVESTPTRVTSRTYTNDGSKYSEQWHLGTRSSNVICVSPMLVQKTYERHDNITIARCDDRSSNSKPYHNNSLQNTPAAVTGSTPMIDLLNVFASPQDQKSASKIMVRSLPLLMNDDDDEGDEDPKNPTARRRLSSHHPLPPRSILPQRSSSSSKLGDDGTCTSHIDSVHRHLAERDLMEDEDLSVLLQLASNHNPSTTRSSSIVFRSSPLLRQSSNRNDDDENADNVTEEDNSDERKIGASLLSKLDSATSDAAQTGRQIGTVCADNTGEEKEPLQHPNTDFDPPPLLGVRSNSSSGSKEIYVGSRPKIRTKRDDTESESKQSSKGKKDIATMKESSSGSKSKMSFAPGSSTATNKGMIANVASNSSASYPIHYPYSMAMVGPSSSSYGGPHPPLAMSGTMRVVVGGPPPPPPPTSSSPPTASAVGTGSTAGANVYGEYPGMSAYPSPYGQYPPPASSHHLPHHAPHHHMMSAYAPYPTSHYPPPPQAPHGHVPSSSTILSLNAVSTAATPKATKATSTAKNSKGFTAKATSKVKLVNDDEIEKKSKTASNGIKRGSSTSAYDSRPFSSNKKKKVSPGTFRTLGTQKSPPSIEQQDKRHLNSASSAWPAKKSKSKAVSPSATSTPSSSDRQKSAAAATVAAVNAAAGGKNSEAAALAAAILRGVTMRPSGKWQAQLYFAGKSRYIGVFDSREKAALAYEIAREKLKNGEGSVGSDKTSTENLVNAARKAAFDGVNAGG